MPFRQILDELLTNTSGAIAALFLDWEGETVELHSLHELDRDDLKTIGAYQGIFLSQLRKLCSDIQFGEPRQFKIEFTRKKVLSIDLKDGYYVVLLLDRECSEGLAWHHLAVCRARLIEEM